MSQSRAKRARSKEQRSGKFNPEQLRGTWHRKPTTQVERNKKAEQRRTLCRRSGDNDGAVRLSARENTPTLALLRGCPGIPKQLLLRQLRQSRRDQERDDGQAQHA